MTLKSRALTVYDIKENSPRHAFVEALNEIEINE